MNQSFKKNPFDRLLHLSTNRQELLVSIGLFSLLGLLSALMLMVGRYVCLQVDDYAYLIYVEQAWNSSDSLWGSIWAELLYTARTWVDWQGTYFSDFLFFVLLARFGKNAAYITTWVTLLPFIFSELYFCRILIRDILKATRVQSYLVCVPLLLTQLMFPSSAVEAFYWMCGSVLYTTIYSFFLLLLASLLRLMFVPAKKVGSRRILLRILIFFLLFAVGGSNYVTAICTLSILLLTLLWVWIRKHPERIFFSASVIWFLACFALSVFSPGAAARQANAEGLGLGATTAILTSFTEALRFLRQWTIRTFVLSVIATLPVMARIAKKSGRAFRLPALFSLFSFCVFASMFTPCLYAIGSVGIGPQRAQNLYRFTMYLFLTVNAQYWVGYLIRRFSGYPFPFSRITWRFARIPLKTALFSLLAVCVIAPMWPYYFGTTVTAVSAYRTLRSGEAASYYAQNEERIHIMETSPEEDIALPPLSSTPYLLHFGDLQPNQNAWENNAYAAYFGKRSVRISE